jgi:hypothetical protein
MSTATEILPEIQEDISEPDGKSHYVRIKALLAGGPVVALCGKKYVPTEILGALDREVCAPCAELYAMLESLE